jgi:ATP-binding cassette subfamily B protein
MKQNKTEPKIVSSFVKIIRFVWQIQPFKTTFLFLLVIVQGFVPAINLWVGKLIIDSVVQGIGRGIDAFHQAFYYLLFLFVVSILANIVSHASTVIQTLLGDIITHKINVRVMDKSTSLDLFYYDNPEFYDKLTRAQREASSRPLMIITVLFRLIKNMITISSMILVLLRFSWLAVGLVIIMAVPQFITQTKYAQKGYSLLFNQTQDSRKMYYFSSILTSISHFKEIKLFNLGDYLLEGYKRIFEKIYGENKRLVFKKSLAAFLVALLSGASYVAVYAYAVYMTIEGRITLGDLTLYAGAYAQSQRMVGAIISNLASLYENNLFINNLFAFFNLEPKLAIPAVPLKLTPHVKKGIEFKNISFRYPGSEKWAVRHLNLRINPGENIALVGENGAGKTTLVKLLSRLYDPQEGEILLDGVDIKNFAPGEYQELIGIVFQDFSQFYLTARENVGAGYIDDVNNIERIKDAASKSGADKVIEGLPGGYESILGKYFDEGSQLSIGEWQKIAIARAFMRDSKILVLDEPTASLDAKTEYEIFRNFKVLTKDKISLLISHRFSTVKMADRIYVLDGGGIVEGGSHEELMLSGKKYYTMFTMQAEHYQ